MTASSEFVWIQPLTTFNHVRRRINECEDLDNLHKIAERIDRLHYNNCLTLTHYLALDRMILDQILCLDKMEILDGQS